MQEARHHLAPPLKSPSGESREGSRGSASREWGFLQDDENTVELVVMLHNIGNVLTASELFWNVNFM